MIHVNQAMESSDSRARRRALERWENEGGRPEQSDQPVSVNRPEAAAQRTRAEPAPPEPRWRA